MTLIKSISGIRGTIGGATGDTLNPLDIVKFTTAYELGELQERPDTIWHYSTYYTEKIPECGTYSSFAVTSYTIGERVRFIRELFTPDEDETFCGPNSKKDWMVYNLSGNKMVVDSDSVAILDSLYKIWKKATVAPDTLIEK